MSEIEKKMYAALRNLFVLLRSFKNRNQRDDVLNLESQIEGAAYGFMRLSLITWEVSENINYVARKIAFDEPILTFYVLK